MADTVTLDPGAGGAVIATDDLGAFGHVQWVKLADGTNGGTTLIASGGGTESTALRVTVATDSTGVLSVDDNGSTISVDDGAGSLTVDAPVGTPAFVRLSDGAAAITALPITDNSGSLTVDNPILSVVGGGTEAAAQRVTIASDSTGVLSVDDNGGSLTVDGTVTINAIPAGTNNIGDVDVLTLPGSLAGIADDAAFTVATTPVLPVGFLADQASTDSVNEGDIGAARMTLDRKQIVTIAPSVDTEGASIHMNIDVDETEDAVKASAGKILGWYLYNDGAAEVYVKLYNDTVANVAVGTTVPVLTIPIPAGSAANVSFADFGGIPLSAAITIAATTGVTTADTGAPATNQVIANVFYL